MRSDWGFKAGRLISMGIPPKKKVDDEVKELVQLYQSSYDFQEFARGVANGLELEIVGVTFTGIVVTPLNADSPFAMRLGDYSSLVLKGQNAPEKRALLAIILLAVAATFFPAADDLENEDCLSKSAQIEDIENVLVSLCEFLEEASSDNTDDAFFRPVASMLLELTPEVSKGINAAFKSRRGSITSVVEHLTEENLLTVRRDASGAPHYFATTRYQKMLRYRAESHLIALKEQMMDDLSKRRTDNPEEADV